MLSHWGDLVASGEELPGPSACPPNVDLRSHDWRPRRDGLALNVMTINVGLVTSEALVLGCDSIASVTSYRVDPFASIQKDRSGKPKVDKSGRFTLKFELADVQEIVTDAWGGVTKMFAINPAPSPVVAVTAGLAKLRDRPISSFGEEFAYEQKINGKILNSV
jgi:hypothetical protein